MHEAAGKVSAGHAHENNCPRGQAHQEQTNEHGRYLQASLWSIHVPDFSSPDIDPSAWVLEEFQNAKVNVSTS